ncbi:hypothetical protein JCM3770_004446 [Rhodotorula araucariae]
MADIAVYAIVGAFSDWSERVAHLRSPVIPLDAASTPPAPPPIPARVARSSDVQFLGPVLTEYGLRLAHYSWATRHAALWLRLCAMLDARAKNLIGCWAGLVQGQSGRENLRAVRAAVDEAGWVEERLKAAIDWCEQRNLKKMKLVRLVQVRRGRRSTATRPTHTDVPPTLLDLPFPLPLAPPSNRLAPFIPRPPPLERETPEQAEERNRPPTYTREADASNGESTLEGGFWDGELEVREYEAGLLEDDDVLELLRIQHPRMS